jgi:MFS family permease
MTSPCLPVGEVTHDGVERGLFGAPLVAVLASSTLPIMSGAVLVPALNDLRGAFDLGPAAAGAVVTAHTLFIALASPLAGSVIDRVGARTPLVAGLVVFGIAGGLGAATSELGWLLASRAVFGVATGFIFTAITVVILDGTSGDRRNVVMGWRAAANQLGGALYPTIGGVAAMVSWRGSFLVYLLALPIAGVVAATLPRGGRHDRPAARVLPVVRASGALRRLYLSSFLAYVALYVVVIFVPQLLEEGGAGGSLVVGLTLSAMNVMAFAVASQFGPLRRRVTAATVLIGAGAAYVLAAAVLVPAPPPALVVVAVLGFGVAHGLVVPSVTVAVGDLAPPPLRGRISSGLGVTNYLGQFSSPYAAAPLVAVSGLAGAFGLLAVAGALVGWLGSAALRRPELCEEEVG